MSEEEEVVCEQCSTVPTQFVILDCDHRFCLFCVSQAFHKDDSGVPCLKCNAPTFLDPDSLNAIRQVKNQNTQPTQPNFAVRPFTTDKRQHVVPLLEDLTVRGHPCLEKLNLCFERSLDRIRNIQFDKQQIKDKCQNARNDIDQEFKALHMYLDSKQEEHYNQLSAIESTFLNNLTIDEEAQQLDIEEMQLLKDEIKSILKCQDGQDLYTFKQLLSTVDDIVAEKQLTINSLNLFKKMQDELQQLAKKQAQFYSDFKRFFNILQPMQINLASPVGITKVENSITRYSIKIYFSDIREQIKELKRKHTSSFNNSQLNNSRFQNSPPKNTFLNEEINNQRKQSRENAGQIRKFGTSPMNAASVLQSTMKSKNRSNSKFSKIINSPIVIGGFSYLG